MQAQVDLCKQIRPGRGFGFGRCCHCKTCLPLRPDPLNPHPISYLSLPPLSCPPLTHSILSLSYLFWWTSLCLPVHARRPVEPYLACSMPRGGAMSLHPQHSFPLLFITWPHLPAPALALFRIRQMQGRVEARKVHRLFHAADPAAVSTHHAHLPLQHPLYASGIEL